jgi:hypothetical protein
MMDFVVDPRGGRIIPISAWRVARTIVPGLESLTRPCQLIQSKRINTAT